VTGAVCAGLGRWIAEHGIDVAAGILKFDIGQGKRADIAAGAGERNPWRRMHLAALIDHLRNVHGI
jgi:hypothetical protein